MTQKKYHKTIFIFRRDLRLEDNTTLNQCAAESEKILPIFIFDDRQVKKKQNEYFSKHAFQFLVDSLVELDGALKKKGSALSFFSGHPDQIIKKLLQEENFDAVYFNKDHTPFACKRDKRIKDLCNSLDKGCVSNWDALLHKPGTILTKTGGPYKVFTPFKKSALSSDPEKPKPLGSAAFYAQVHSLAQGVHFAREQLTDFERNENLAQVPGRDEALDIIEHIQDFANYNEERDYPAKSGTTKLSGHLKFGSISPREVYWQVVKMFGKSHGLVNELYWRDFYAHLMWHYPELLGQEMQEKYRTLRWENDKEKFEKWCRGKTGFPIVDAAMRELNQTGWMHNRMRMTVASFLIKDLHIDWQWGERYFAQQLLDYDPASNNGGWQWAASTGADAQPYFRIFNPWSQQKRFDPEARYIKKYVPELSNLSASEIHKIEKGVVPEGVDYPAAMVNHQDERKTALAQYEQHK